VFLPKHHAGEGRVSLYEGYFYFTGFVGTSQGVEAHNGAEEEEASGACWETQHHIWKRDQSFPTNSRAREKPTSKHARAIRWSPPTGAQHLALGRASAHDLNSHGRTSCCRQRATRTIRGGATYAAVLAGPVAPSQLSGPLKPTAMDSDSSEPGVSMETTNRRMFTDMSGPLSGMPDGTTSNAQDANACLPAGERPNKTPIFISGVRDKRSLLAWLRVSCPGGLMAQLKGEKLIVVPSNADRFTAAVKALRSLDGKDGVTFHTFTLPEDRCARLLVKNLGRGMPESVVREELESLKIRVQGVTLLRSGRRDPDPAKTAPSPSPTSLY